MMLTIEDLGASQQLGRTAMGAVVGGNGFARRNTAAEANNPRNAQPLLVFSEIVDPQTDRPQVSPMSRPTISGSR